MRILVADDDLVSRLAMEAVLSRCGRPEIRVAEDGPAAWAALQRDDCFDLVCLDVRMPPPDGLELVARLRASPGLRRVPALLITSTLDRDTASRVAGADLQGFLVKPVGAETVTRIVRVLAQLDATLLEPAPIAMARLRVDAERHARYVAAFVQQVRALASLARDLATPQADPAAQATARAAFVQKAAACRTAALTLGAPRIEQVISDAANASQEAQPGAEKAMAQAVYWLERTTGHRWPAAGSA